MTEILSEKRCLACEGGIPALTAPQIKTMMTEIPKWQLNDCGKEISRQFDFKNYYHTMAFVNAIAWVAHQENHHPDLEVSYNSLLIRYSTHAVQGVTENDLICAAKIDKLSQF